MIEATKSVLKTCALSVVFTAAVGCMAESTEEAQLSESAIEDGRTARSTEGQSVVPVVYRGRKGKEYVPFCHAVVLQKRKNALRYIKELRVVTTAGCIYRSISIEPNGSWLPAPVLVSSIVGQAGREYIDGEAVDYQDRIGVIFGYGSGGKPVIGYAKTVYMGPNVGSEILRSDEGLVIMDVERPEDATPGMLLGIDTAALSQVEIPVPSPEDKPKALKYTGFKAISVDLDVDPLVEPAPLRKAVALRVMHDAPLNLAYEDEIKKNSVFYPNGKGRLQNSDAGSPVFHRGLRDADNRLVALIAHPLSPDSTYNSFVAWRPTDDFQPDWGSIPYRAINLLPYIHFLIEPNKWASEIREYVDPKQH